MEFVYKHSPDVVCLQAFAIWSPFVSMHSLDGVSKQGIRHMVPEFGRFHAFARWSLQTRHSPDGV